MVRGFFKIYYKHCRYTLSVYILWTFVAMEFCNNKNGFDIASTCRSRLAGDNHLDHVTGY